MYPDPTLVSHDVGSHCSVPTPGSKQAYPRRKERERACRGFRIAHCRDRLSIAYQASDPQQAAQSNRNTLVVQAAPWLGTHDLAAMWKTMSVGCTVVRHTPVCHTRWPAHYGPVVDRQWRLASGYRGRQSASLPAQHCPARGPSRLLAPPGPRGLWLGPPATNHVPQVGRSDHTAHTCSVVRASARTTDSAPRRLL